MLHGVGHLLARLLLKTLHPGKVLICNDLTGKGHVTRAISGLIVAFVNRANS